MGETRKIQGPLNRLCGRVQVPTSKSLTNRALIAAAVAGGGEILDPLDCEDTRLLAHALAQAGWQISWRPGRIEVEARQATLSVARCDLGNSGTGSRLLLSLLATTDGSFIVDGTSRLRERPMGPLIDALAELGADIQSEAGCLPVHINGRRLRGGELTLRPQVSSQFVTSLVMAAPLMEAGLDLRLAGEVPSRPYLELTIDVVEHFGGGLEVTESGARWHVSARALTPSSLKIEGDWSAAAFFLCAAGVVESDVEVVGVNLASRQGDRAVCGILAEAGVEISQSETGVRATGPARSGLQVDLSNTPDLFPALAALAGTLPFPSVFGGLEHLKHKESDRLAVMVENLGALGAHMESKGQRLTFQAPIKSQAKLRRGVTAAADHRIAMAMAIAAIAGGPLEIDDATCVQKSFPGFWKEWQRLIE